MKNNFSIVVALMLIGMPLHVVYAALSCSLTTSALCSGTVVLRLSGSDNAHAELPSQATAVYDSNVICCSGVTGLGNSCSGNYGVLAKLSGVTNAHVEENTESNYGQNACLSSVYAGDIITIGYESVDCTGYDTTVASMSGTPTNAQAGGPSAYTNKICADIFSQAISFTVSDNTIGFGSLSSSALRYATGDGTGSSTQTEAFNMTVNTNAPYGYILTVQGDTLTSGGNTITAIGGTNTTPTAGTNRFGIRATATGGSGAVSSPYSASGFAYAGTTTTASTLASASTGDDVTTTYSVRSVATIEQVLPAGSYTTTLTFVATPTF
ncbi:MAG: hypothetical protein WC059_00715 [Candidatus Paceibacterota bacterium]